MAERAAPVHGAAAGGADYYPAFDWLRAALAVVVMLYHDRVLPWGHAASFAVEVFFALSGWLIGGVLLQQTRADLPRFFFNRAIRIWVPYFIALALLLAASLLKDPVTPKWLEFVAYKLSFVYNLFGPPQLAQYGSAMPLGGTGNHFWSVNAEEQFYLLAPLLLVLAARFGRHWLTWGLLALVAWVGHYYAGIVFGVLSAVLVHHFGAIHRTALGRGVLWVAALGSAALLVGNLFPYEFVAPVSAVSIVLLLAVPGERQPLGALAGGMSYQLYLNHWIGVFVANALLGRFGLRESPIRQVLAVVISVMLATALYWWIDRRMLARRNAWFTPTRGQLAMATGYAMVAMGLTLGLTLLLSR